MSLLPSIHDKDESFNAGMKWAAIVGTLVLLPLIVFFQHFLGTLRGATLSRPLNEISASEVARDPEISGLILTSKSVLKEVYFTIESVWEDVSETGAPLGRHAEIEGLQAAVAELDAMALSRVDRLRVAMVVGELQGPEAALERVQQIKREAMDGGALSIEAHTLERYYAAAAMGQDAPIEPDAAAALIARHGWFGRLATTFDDPPGSADREYTLGGYGALEVFFGAQTLVGFLAFVAGLGAFTLLVYRMRTGLTTFRILETGVPRIIMLETFACFLFAFFLVLIGGVLFIGSTSLTSVVISEMLMWSCGLALLWPLARGVSWDDLRDDLGLSSGEGIHKELFAGVLGYLAGLPLILVVSLIAITAEQAIMGEEVGPEGFPMFETPLAGSWAGLMIGAVGACLWAPLVEEALFRGALHSYLPAWMGVLGRCLLVGAIFGLIHPYSPAGMIQVGAAGVVLGFLREWRGSLIAPITAHFLHNATITATTIAIVSMLD